MKYMFVIRDCGHGRCAVHLQSDPPTTAAAFERTTTPAALFAKQLAQRIAHDVKGFDFAHFADDDTGEAIDARAVFNAREEVDQC